MSLSETSVRIFCAPFDDVCLCLKISFYSCNKNIKLKTKENTSIQLVNKTCKSKQNEVSLSYIDLLKQMFLILVAIVNVSTIAVLGLLQVSFEIFQTKFFI